MLTLETVSKFLDQRALAQGTLRKAETESVQADDETALTPASTSESECDPFTTVIIKAGQDLKETRKRKKGTPEYHGILDDACKRIRTATEGLKRNAGIAEDHEAR